MAIQNKRRLIPRWRKATWALVVFNILMLIWVISGVASVNGGNCNGLDQATCNAAKAVGTGIGVGILVFIWFIGFVILGLVWLMSRPHHRQCPQCGNDVKKGLIACRVCGYDFRQPMAQLPPMVPPPPPPPV